MGQVRADLLSLSILFAACLARSESHFEVLTPYEGEIFDHADAYFEYNVHGHFAGYQVLIAINGNEIMRTREVHVRVAVPGLPAGLHHLLLQVLDDTGKPGLLDHYTAFEITRLQAPESIIPIPQGAVGIRSEELPIDPSMDFARYSPKVQEMLYNHQHPPQTSCRSMPFLIWEPWGIVGFGAQLLGLRVAMSLGLQTQRVVVGNPDWENNLVNSELKWRFNLTESNQGSPWGELGSLQELSWCASSSNVLESVRALPGVDMNDISISNVRISWDLWGVENRERIFEMPEVAMKLLPEPPNLFWWWTETTHYLHRPKPKLGSFIEAQKKLMGWEHPIIGIHMRLGVDKNREAQRFPTKYYIHEARRIRKLFGGVGTIFVCSDRKSAVTKMISEYGKEFRIITQPKVEGALPMEYVHTDLALLGECDYLIFTFSSNFGMAAFYLNSFLHGHRPTYVSMDDLFEGFRYYGHQMTLTFNHQNGVSELGVRVCASQLTAGNQTLLLIDDKRDSAVEICANLLGEEYCKSPRTLKDQETGTILWDSDSCTVAEDWDACTERLHETYRSIVAQSDKVREKGDCEEECDDKSCSSLSEGNRRVLGFGFRIFNDEL